MTRFKKGDVVWILLPDRFGYPRLYKPGKVVRRVHPTCYIVAETVSDIRKTPPETWSMRHGVQRHPADLFSFALDPQEHLKMLVARWQAETPPETIAERKAYEAEREEISRRLTRQLAPLFGFMNKETKRRLRR